MNPPAHSQPTRPQRLVPSRLCKMQRRHSAKGAWANNIRYHRGLVQPIDVDDPVLHKTLWLGSRRLFPAMHLQMRNHILVGRLHELPLACGRSSNSMRLRVRVPGGLGMHTEWALAIDADQPSIETALAGGARGARTRDPPAPRPARAAGREEPVMASSPGASQSRARRPVIPSLSDSITQDLSQNDLSKT